MATTSADARPLRIGTRGSALALAQSGQTAQRLTDAGIANELVIVPGAGHGGHAARLAAIAKFCAAKLEPAK
jgi:porphobilinogen deaminase